MPFDSMTMAAIADEVGAAAGGRIQRILQPSGASIALAIYIAGSQRWLLLSADARYARVHFLEDRVAKGFATPSGFVMLLRKYLDGARLTSVQHVPYERILHLTFRAAGVETRLTAEVMGKHSNIILTDEGDRILGAVKIVSSRLSRVRPIMPGLPYVPPPTRERDTSLFSPGPRVDPALDAWGVHSLLAAGAPDTTLADALLGCLPGSGPFLAEQISLHAGAIANTRLADAPLDRVVQSASRLYGLLRSRAWSPCTFEDSRGRHDFAPYLPVTDREITPVDSISVAIDRCLSGYESRDALGVARKAVLAEIQRARNAAAGRAASLREGMEAAEDADALMQKGQLILAYQHVLGPRATSLSIEDLDMVIPLDPDLTPAENAERAFRRYRKLRDAGKKIPALLEKAEADESTLSDLEVFARLADSESTLGDLRREIAPAAPSGDQSKKRPRKRGPMRFGREGFIALVGRNARENDSLTFGLARRDELWLHARGWTGAHVVLQGPTVPPDDVLAAAARLAAYFSEGRSDSAVDVEAALVRDVRKIPGDPPGRVTYRAARTIRVEPGIDDWERL